jgi:hypothetical protein
MAADTVSGLFERGKTYYHGTSKTLSSSYGTSVDYEGTVRSFPDITVSSGGMKTKNSGRTVTCILVRNTCSSSSGTAGKLLPGRLVAWQTGYIGRRVNGYTTTDYARVAGVVDEHLPAAGVPQYDLFWLVVKGPTKVVNALSQVADIAEGDFLVALTAATSGSITSGHPQKLVVASTDAVTVHGQFIGVFGRALTAKLSSSTNSTFVVDVDTMPV